jgi:prevent-host-death family protein
MKIMPLRAAKEQLSGCVNESQRQRILITKRGRPAALMVGVEGRDLEDVILMQNPKFWELIEARRAQPSLSFEQVRRRFDRSRGRKRNRRP